VQAKTCSGKAPTLVYLKEQATYHCVLHFRSLKRLAFFAAPHICTVGIFLRLEQYFLIVMPCLYTASIGTEHTRVRMGRLNWSF